VRRTGLLADRKDTVQHHRLSSALTLTVSQGDPDPVSLKIDPVVVEAPVVTNWHSDPSDAVPLTP
jgi:hypothetical protein